MTRTPVSSARRTILAIAEPDLALTTPGSSIVIPVLANDIGDGLSIIGLTLPANGIVNVDPATSITYTPNSGFTGIDSFAYTIRDSVGGTSSTTVSVDVALPNAAPLAVDDEFDVQAGGEVTIPVIANDNDPDGDPLTLVAVTLPANGSLGLLPDQSLHYVPDAGFVGDECFSYTISDGQGGQDQGTVLIHVLSANSAPSASDDMLVVEAGASGLVDAVANDNDPDGDPLEIIGYSMPSHGSVSLETDGRFRYTPAAGFEGPDQFSYTVRDSGGLQDGATVHVDVQPAAAGGFARGMWMAVPSAGVALDDVVLLVDETHDDLRCTTQGGQVVSADGDDILFEELSTGAELPREILHHDAQTGRVIAAVRLGSLPASGDLDMRLLAGNGSAVASDAGVWGGFLAAWAGTDGVNRAGNAALDLVPAGLAGGTDLPFAAAFDGTGHASHADGSFLNGLTEIEICAQVRSAATGVDARILAQGPHTGAQGAHGLLLTYDAIGYQGQAADVVTAVIATDAGVVRIESEAGVQTTDIQHIALRWKSGSQISMEIDGRPVTPSWVGTIVNGVATSGAVLEGTIQLPAGSFEMGGLITDPWVGEIGLVTMRSTMAGAARGLFDGIGRSDPHRAYGVSQMVALPVNSMPVVALPVIAGQAIGEAVDHDVAAAFHGEEGASVTLAGVGTALLDGASATLVAGKLRYVAGSTAGADKVTFTLDDGTCQSAACLYLDVAAGSSGSGTTSPDELPTPLRTVNVTSRSQLDTALAAALPGDEIVLADGQYGSTPINLTSFGTADHPIVIRAANRMGAWLPGIDFPTASHDIHVHDIDLRETNGTDLRGKRNWLVRCWLKPKYFASSQTGSVCVSVHGGSATSFADACRIAYCNFELQTDEEATNGWTDTICHCVRGNHDGSTGTPWHKYLVIERFRLIGGPTRLSYHQPNGEFIEDVESRQSSAEPINWWVGWFYGDNLPTRETIIDSKASGVTYGYGTVYSASGRGRIQNRQGGHNRFFSLSGSAIWKFEAGPNVLVHDCEVIAGNKMMLLMGTVPWDTPLSQDGHRQIKDMVIGNTSGGGYIEVGTDFGTKYAYKPLNVRIEGTQPDGGYVELNGSQVAAVTSSTPSFTPTALVRVSPDEVGIDAPWVGLTTPADP
ncbi:MAG: Ig-like domain-containing protein [Geminicoccaceae bacterium]